MLYISSDSVAQYKSKCHNYDAGHLKCAKYDNCRGHMIKFRKENMRKGGIWV